MTANHGYPTSRESILSLFSSSAQLRRNLAEAKAPELFVLLHGMIFTHIQLDDFQPTLARYLERLQLDGAQEREWIMMAIVNVSAILNYGKDGPIKPAVSSEPSGNTMAGKKRELVMKMDSLAVSDAPTSKMDVDSSSPPPSESMAVDIPYTLQLSLQLAFETLAFCLQHPFRRSSPFARPTLNPYITVFLTFLTTILKQPDVLPIIERSVPWKELITFLRSAPRAELQSEVALHARLTSGCAPLPEDWCLRGMQWLGRRVYEHGFWKPKPDLSGEMDVLLEDEAEEQETDGIIEDDEDEFDGGRVKSGQRWVRIIRASLAMTQTVPGFQFDRSKMVWELGEEMNQKAAAWAEEERLDREAEERRRSKVWDMDDDEMDLDADEEVEDEDEWDEDPEVRALQVCLLL